MGMSSLAAYARFVDVVRVVLLAVGILVAIVCVLDWAVRTRRVSPFGRTSRFTRSRVDPLLRPIERMVVRAGGIPSSAAWWGFVAYLVFAILLVALLSLLGRLFMELTFAVAEPGQLWMLVVSWIFSILRIALIVRVVASWLPISPRSRWLWWSFVLTEWMIRPLQRIIPRIGMFDITPIVAWIALGLIQAALGIP